MRIDWVPVVRCAHSKRPGQRSSRLPSVLRIDVQVKEVIRLGIGQRERFGGARCYPINELRQGRIVNHWNRALAEVIVIQAQDSGVCSKPQFVRPDAPSEIIVDEEPKSAPALNPGVIESAEGGKGRIRPAALQHDRKRVERLLKITRAE